MRAVRDSGLGYRSPCLDGLVNGGLYLLRGPRRVGKTVAVKQTIVDLVGRGTPPQTIVRIAADAWSAEDLRTVVQNTALPPVPPGTTRWWLFDEITGTTGDWAAQIKWLRDNDPEFALATVVLTGSSAAGLTTASGVLAGRRGRIDHGDRTLLPLGFRTFARLLRPHLPGVPAVDLARLRGDTARTAYAELLPWLDDLVIAWETYLMYGGFPIAVAAARAGTPVPAWFVDDVFNVVFRDAFAASQRSQTSTAALMERLMQSMAAPANMSRIGADLDLKHDVVARHIRYLGDAYLLWHCPQKAERAWTARERAQDKLYAIDPLVARLAHLRNPARSDIDITVLTEMQTGLALQRCAYAHGTGWAEDLFLFHLRASSRREIDFVAEQLAGTAVESKYVEGGAWRGATATISAAGYGGLMVTRNVLDTRDENGPWAIPAGILCYLIDT
ncbi:AAA family ATPase [Protofrankia coriariae]|uniref:AAA family ATPase n=1 Tax=Protofrankia coriariae TaxID=1562887 RepID=UPI000A3291A1